MLSNLYLLSLASKSETYDNMNNVKVLINMHQWSRPCWGGQGESCIAWILKMFYHCANKYMKDACFWKGRVTTEENFVCLFVCLFTLVCCYFILCNIILHRFKKNYQAMLVISISIPTCNKVSRKYQLEVVKLMLHKFWGTFKGLKLSII